jgi:predicted acetyltransferase
MRFVAAWDRHYLSSYVDALEEGFHVGNAANPSVSRLELLRIRDDPEGWARTQASDTSPYLLPNGQLLERVEQTVLWWVDASSFIGAFEIRHSLTSAMFAAYGGHISFGIRPSFRGPGNGRQISMMGQAALAEAAKLGIKRLMACCRSTNHRSEAWIRSAGGIYMDEVPIPYSDQPAVLKRFIIPTPADRIA